MRISDQALRGRTVIGADGRALGEVAGITIEAGDSERPHLETIQIKLRREIEDELGVEHRRLRAATIEVPFASVQSIGDAVVLSISVPTLRTMVGPEEQPTAP
jgi:sporulation protein YlmC with PRC-barrel domain